MKHHMTDHSGICILCGANLRNITTGHRKGGAEHLPMSDRWCNGAVPQEVWPLLFNHERLQAAISAMYN